QEKRELEIEELEVRKILEGKEETKIKFNKNEIKDEKENMEGLYIGLGLDFSSSIEMKILNISFSEKTKKSNYIKIEYYTGLNSRNIQFGLGTEFNLSDVKVVDDGKIEDLSTIYLAGKYFNKSYKDEYSIFKIGKVSKIDGDTDLKSYIKTDSSGNFAGFGQLDFNGKSFYSYGVGYPVSSGFVELTHSFYEAYAYQFILGNNYKIKYKFEKFELSYIHKF
ncbi:MAG: hypothetical protein WC002_10720, partial [Candidatus Muiribacteriota bacterium]